MLKCRAIGKIYFNRDLSCNGKKKKKIKYEIAKSDIREKFDEFLCRRHTYLRAQRFTIVSRLNSENDCYDANGKEYMEKYSL